jgi:hypothetical protein
MAVKAVNDLAKPDKIVLILLVFGLYLRIIEINLPLFTIAKKAKAIRATTKEIRRLYTKQQVSDAFAMRNSLNIIATKELPL